MYLQLFFIFILFPSSLAFAQIDDSHYNIGKVEWSSQKFHNSQILVHKLTVIDSDMNQNFSKIEKFPIRVWSESDLNGIQINVYETGKNSEKFETLVYFSEDKSSGQRLQALAGENITALYVDKTLPITHEKSEESVMTSFILIDTFELSDSDNPEPSVFRGILSTQTIPNTAAITIIKALGGSLIIIFIIIYAIKKRRK